MNRRGDELDLEAAFGPGTVPDAVLEAVAAQVAARPRLVTPRPTTAQVDGFFGDLAELVKRARGEP